MGSFRSGTGAQVQHSEGHDVDNITCTDNNRLTRIFCVYIIVVVQRIAGPHRREEAWQESLWD